MRVYAYICLLLALALLSGCVHEPAGYELRCIVPNSADVQGRMLTLLRDDSIRIDSVEVNDTIAIFRGAALEEPCVASLLIGRAVAVQFILENGSISVDVKKNLGAYGTPLNDQLYEMNKRVDSIERRSLYAGLLPAHPTEMELKARDMVIQERSATLQSEYFARHKNDVLGTIILRDLLISSSDLSSPSLRGMLSTAGPRVLADPVVRRHTTRLNNRYLTAEGKMYRDFSGIDVSGDSISVSSIMKKGRYVLLDFWASWCRPCIELTPRLRYAWEKYGHRSLTIVGVSVWDKYQDHIGSTLEMKLPFPQIFTAGSERGSVADLYGIQSVPYLVLINPDGQIVERGDALRGDAFYLTLEKYLR